MKKIYLFALFLFAVFSAAFCKAQYLPGYASSVPPSQDNAVGVTLDWFQANFLTFVPERANNPSEFEYYRTQLVRLLASTVSNPSTPSTQPSFTGYLVGAYCCYYINPGPTISNWSMAGNPNIVYSNPAPSSNLNVNPLGDFSNPNSTDIALETFSATCLQLNPQNAANPSLFALYQNGIRNYRLWAIFFPSEATVLGQGSSNMVILAYLNYYYNPSLEWQVYAAEGHPQL